MAREIGNWTKPDGQASRPNGAATRNDARIAKALEPGERIVQRIPLSGLALDTFNLLFWFAFAGISALVVPLSYIANPDQRWFIGPLALAWTVLVAWGMWNSFTLPLRQAAVLTDRRVLLVSFGQILTARRAGQVSEPQGWSAAIPDLGIKKLLIRGAREKGSICLGQVSLARRPGRKGVTYPPFTLFGVERPFEVAAQINETLKLNLPVTDKTE